MTGHCTRDGTPKLVERCSHALTGAGVVDRVYTDLAVLDIAAHGFVVIDLSPGVSMKDVAALTAAPVHGGLRSRNTPDEAPVNR